jgi:hypothetical protein
VSVHDCISCVCVEETERKGLIVESRFEGGISFAFETKEEISPSGLALCSDSPIEAASQLAVKIATIIGAIRGAGEKPAALKTLNTASIEEAQAAS